MQRLDTKHRTELKRVGKVRSHWGPRDLFWHLITEEEEGDASKVKNQQNKNMKELLEKNGIILNLE